MRVQVELKIKLISLIEERNKQNLSQQTLSKLSGVSIEIISAIENMKIFSNDPDLILEKLEKISSALDVDFHYLFPEEYLEAIKRELLPHSKERFIEIIDVAIHSLPLGNITSTALLPEEIVEKRDMQDILNQIINQLPPRERKILEIRYGLNGNDPHTLEEAGSMFEVTRERIRSIEATAISRLRHPSIRKTINEYNNR